MVKINLNKYYVIKLMNSVQYFSGLFGTSSAMIFGLKIYEQNWKCTKTNNFGLYDGYYAVLCGILGASFCGLGMCLIDNQK